MALHADDVVLRHELGRLRVLYALAETLMASPDVAHVYAAAMDGLRDALAVDRVAILVTDASRGALRFAAWRGLSDAYRRAVEGHTFWAADDPAPAPVVVTDVTTDARMDGVRDAVLAEGIAALVALPLVVKGRVLGQCMLYFAAPRQLADDDLRLALTIADHVAFGIERKRAEADLWATTAMLRAIVDGTPDSIVVKDLQGRYLLTNRAADAFVGRGPGTVEGLDPDAVFSPESARVVKSADRRAIEQRRTFSHDEFLTDARGRTRAFYATRGPLFDAAGEVRGVFGILRDITERRETQERLRQSEERFRALLQNASDITTVLATDGTVRYQSPAFYRLLGWSEAQAIGRSVFALVHPDDRDDATAAFADTLQAGGASRLVEYRMQRADGSYATLEAIAVNRLDDPAIGGVVVNSRDVTERNRLAAELRQAQKMEAIGRLAGGIAHDFNNLLTVIGGYSEAALREPDPVEVQRCLEEVRRAAARASGLTSQLLAFARRRVISPSAVDLNSAIETLAAMLQRLIGSDVRLDTALDPRVGFITVDAGQLEQVVMNLAINARDAMPEGGVLTLATSLEDDATAVLTVRDSGRGMDRDTVSRVFEPFFTTKGPGQGTGLGLATVYGIVTQHGGTIAVDSAPGRGTTFRLTFPRDGAAGAAALAAPSRVADAAGTETILLVEDEPLVRSLVRSMLRAQGYTVWDAESGEDAVARFLEVLPKVHLLLTDVVMPGMNGRVLAERLTAERPGLKVMFMSGYTEDAVLGAGGRDVHFLQKPFTTDALLALVRQALDTGPASPG